MAPVNLKKKHKETLNFLGEASEGFSHVVDPFDHTIRKWQSFNETSQQKFLYLNKIVQQCTFFCLLDTKHILIIDKHVRWWCHFSSFYKKISAPKFIVHTTLVVKNWPILESRQKCTGNSCHSKEMCKYSKETLRSCFCSHQKDLWSMGSKDWREATGEWVQKWGNEEDPLHERFLNE